MADPPKLYTDPNAIRQTRDLISESRFGEMLPAPRPTEPTEPTEVGLKPPKNLGQIVRGIGNLAVRKRLFPFIQAAQMAWGTLSDEQKSGVEDFFEKDVHELLGMEKSGLEYFKDFLGISEEDLPPSNLPDKATTVKRAPDFAESGEYVVTFGDGSTERIFRDTFQFGYSVWHRVGEDDPFNMGLGSTKAEALERLEERYQSQKKYEAGLNKAHGGFVVKPLYDRAP